jgi:protein-S-isoprenylcysteine O-methyltransferase Ste14
MSSVFKYLFPALWLTYLLYWWMMARNVKTNQRREAISSRLTRTLMVVLSALLLAFPRLPVPLLHTRFLPPGQWYFWIGAALTAGGLMFSIWARSHLGKNWSRAVTIKEDHELITSGPYGIVRHPIYTGLLLALLGMAVALGEWRGAVAVALVFLALWRKLRLEEKWMHAKFGTSYDSYCRRVPALLPYLT